MIGQTISHYRITEKIGEGGMGEVYRAEDTALNRTVALKFLPAALQEDTIAHRRFLREARSAAALDHPYICNIFEVAERDDGTNFIAMEYLEGETLQTRLESGPLTLKESLKLGSELAEALESAHSKGIVHRDLKPANIMLTTSGHAKVMDFGLAKKLVGEDGREQDISSALTREGATLGTLSYMSPEQLRGQPVDYRSDIFSLGIVLYEMLSGVHPFRKSQAAETTGAILRDDPPSLERFVTELPEVLRHTVEKMLAKDPAERYQSVHEVLTNLNQLREDSGKIKWTEDKRARGIYGWPWIAMAAVLGASIGALGMWSFWLSGRVQTASAPLLRASIVLPEGERLASGWNFRPALAISPDGRWLAYASYKPGTSTKQDERPLIKLRRLDQTEVRSIPGLTFPFFSPDSRQLGFVAGDSEGGFSLKRTDVEGGPVEPVTVVESGASFGYVWLPDDRIVFSPRQDSGLAVVPAVGGEPRPLTELSASEEEHSHRLPSALPNGGILYTAVRFSGDWSLSQIVAFRPDTGEKKVLIEDGSHGRYVESGHLVFAREGRLMAVRFDPDRLEVRGDPVPVLDGLVHSVYTDQPARETGAAQFGVSRAGLLVFAPGTVYPERKTRLVWVDRMGSEEPLVIEPKTWRSARISADSRQILLTTDYPPYRVFLYDRERHTLRPQTFEGRTSCAIWGPREGEFTFDSDRDGPLGIYIKSADSGTGFGQKLQTGFQDLHAPSSWAPDGQWLAFVADRDIWLLDPEGARVSALQTRFGERFPEFSPDGRWMAYTSNQSGRWEVYVRPFPGTGKAVQISTAGGWEPCWSRDGREIFFSSWSWDPDLSQREYYAVPVTVRRGDLIPGLPEKLFQGAYEGSFPVRGYDVDSDGRFLLRKFDPEHRGRIRESMAPTRIELVQNWFEELSKKVPTE